MRPSIVGLAAVLVALAACASKEKTSMKIYVQQKLYDKAIAQGSVALESNPNDGDTHYFMGTAYYGKDLDLQPEHPAYADSSAAYVRNAHAHFEKAKQLAPEAWGKSADDHIASMFGSHFNRGVGASKKNAHAQAAFEYRLASIANPENYQGWYTHATATMALAAAAERTDAAAANAMYAAVLEDLDKVIALQPADKEKLVSAYHTKGEVLIRQGDAEGGQEAYRKAVELDPQNYEMRCRMGARYFNQGDYARATEYLTQCLSIQERLSLIDADDAETFTAIGNAYWKQGRWNEALPAFQKALDLQPGSENSIYDLLVTHYKAGEAAEKAGRKSEAKAHYKECVKMCARLTAMNGKKFEYQKICAYCKSRQ
jgi:tetratricopeptide (TPR) repeat protein